MCITEREIQKNVMSNLNYVMRKFEIGSQKELAEKLDIGAPQLTRLMHGDQTPTVYPFLVKVKEHFGYTIDEFLYVNLKQRDEIDTGDRTDIPVASYMKFAGLYQMYYFDTSSFKGRERADDADALKSGLLLIQQSKQSERDYEVIAVFDMQKEYADVCYCNALKHGASNTDYIWRYIQSLSGKHHVYHGTFDLSAKHVYINLRFENTRDRVQMIFHRPDSNAKKYIGGLGTVISVSKGRNSEPCVQYIALSETSLASSEEEIASHLLMHYPNLKTYDSIDDLVNMIAQLYQYNDIEKDRLTDEQKKTLVRNHVDKIVNDTVEKNLFRTVVVSSADDDEFYHYLKRVRNSMR